MLRLIDANANRALEGLRVCEEIVRFHFASGAPSTPLRAPSRARSRDAALFRRCRALRHGIAGAIRRLPVSRLALVAARGSERDVGRKAPAARVATLEHLLVINLQRAKESLRTLEECARLLAPAQAAAFQRLRFRTYDLERALLLRLAAVRHP